ncbi:hypothetical protein ABXS71_16750 [Bacillus infantis]|uniref:hypothetical protein n=1 Tax=Bacillus infantis TaxID=324767 RepID=UPI00344DD539
MKKIAITIIVLLLNITGPVVNAHNQNDFEFIKQHKMNGYGPFGEAIQQFEKNNNIKVDVPSVFPFKVTHKFGKIDEERKLNLRFVNKSTGQFIKMYVTPEKNYFTEKTLGGILKDGTPVMINRVHPYGTSIEFSRNNLSYCIYLSHLMNSKKYSDEDLIGIANSIK